MTARQPTKPQPAKRQPRPVVRVVIDIFPTEIKDHEATEKQWDEWVRERVKVHAPFLFHYRRPRVISVRRVRGGAK